jgi:hypothetical protein
VQVHQLNLRRGKRYPQSAAVSFWWERANGILQEGQGTTLDISSHGVFVVVTPPPPAGVHLELKVYLPSASGAPKSVQLHGEGKVVRVGRKGRELGFAAEVIFQTESSGDSFSFGSGGVIQ